MKVVAIYRIDFENGPSTFLNGEILKQWRKRLGLSQAALAEHAGVSHKTIREYEKDRHALQTAKVEAIVKALLAEEKAVVK